MRRVAALYDVHGNLPALEAVLAAVDEAGAEQIIVGGDVVLGPMPRESLERLLALGPRTRFLSGNCDRLVVSALDGDLAPLAKMPAAVRDTVVWTAAQLDRSHRDVLASWPTTLTADVPALGEVLFCHATPRSDEELFTRLSPEARVAPMLDGVEQRVVVCGHTHMAFDREVAGTRVVNAGSVGMPYGEPGAHWLLLGPDVQLTCTTYDLERAAEQVRRTSYPQAAEFAAANVLAPRSEAEMLRLFEPISPSA